MNDSRAWQLVALASVILFISVRRYRLKLRRVRQRPDPFANIGPDGRPRRVEVVGFDGLWPRLRDAAAGDLGKPERHPTMPGYRVSEMRWHGLKMGRDGRPRDAVVVLTYGRDEDH